MFEYHEGERAIQDEAGERQLAARVGRDIGDNVFAAARSFLSSRPMLFVASEDAAGQPCASVLFGPEGLVRTEDGDTVTLRFDGVSRRPEDALWTNLVEGAAVGLLAIDLFDRKRLRINGVLERVDAHHARLRVREAYANCPKYIQSRRLISMRIGEDTSQLVEVGESLDEARRLAVADTDTFFVASRHPERGLDMSHRGGPPGFVRVVDARRLRIPDYRGNGMFNTLGNLSVDGRAAILIVRFEQNRMLQLNGRAAISIGRDDPDLAAGGTGRFWDFSLERWQESPLGARVEWGSVEFSRFNPGALGSGT